MPILETKLYEGQLALKGWGEADDILFLSSVDEPLAELLQSDISGHMVSVRYWITDVQVSREAAQEAFVLSLMGAADCICESRYSEATGYLWTDEEIKIGGHDLLAELQSHAGKWLILEVDIHQ